MFVFAFQNCKVQEGEVTIKSEETPEPTSTEEESGCERDEYSTSKLCDRRKPSHSTCLEQDSGCYAWECDTDYTRSNNECVSDDAPAPVPEGDCEVGEHTSRISCNNDRRRPSHSTCLEQDSGCYAWECDTEYQEMGGKCINCTLEPTLSECTETINGECGEPPYSSTSLCKAGIYQVSPSDSRQWSCQGVNNGTNDTDCNTCAADTYVFKSTCDNDTSKPAHSHCIQIATGESGAGCYKWNCDNGYRLNATNDGCEQMPVNTDVNGKCPSSRPYNPTRLCEQGEPSVASSPLPAQWNCNGLNNGANDINCNTCPPPTEAEITCEVPGECPIASTTRIVKTYPFEALCQKESPSNSTCLIVGASSPLGAGCYLWDCNRDYVLNSDGTACLKQSDILATTTTTPTPGTTSQCPSPTMAQITCSICASPVSRLVTFYSSEELCLNNKPDSSLCAKVGNAEGGIPNDAIGCWVWLCSQDYKYSDDGSACIP